MKIKLIGLASLLGATLFCIPTAHAQSGRQAAAIFLRDSPKSGHLSSDPYGDNGSSARQNIVDTARCQTAETSYRAHTGKIQVWLHSTMLISMKNMIQGYGYSYYCGFIAGGQHSSGSYHYRGTAMDISTINGRGVSSSNPYWRTFNQRCRDRGAVESLGPGYPGHSTHVHNAWPSGGSASSSGGCLTQVSAPTGLNAVAMSTSSIKLTWNDTSSINTAQLLQKSGTSSSGPWSTAASLGSTAESHTETGLAAGKRYWFRIRASNSSDTSPWSGVDNAVTKENAPVAPAGLTATAVSNDQINLAWGNVSNEDGFRIYRSGDNVTYSLIKTVGANVVTYNNTGLTGNRKYYYRVRAYNTGGNSGYSNTASDTTAPPAPTALTAASGSGDSWNTVNLAWTDNAGSEVGFKIERAAASAGPFSQIATNAASDITYPNTGLAANTTYWYRVRSYNANGNSDYSNTVTGRPGNAPPVLGAIGYKTVAAGANLAFTATATDPNASSTTTTWQAFTSFPHNTPNETILFKKPANSLTTSAFIDTAVTNYTRVVSNGPSAWGTGNKSMIAGWTFKTGTANYWVRLNTSNTATNGNPIIALDQKLQFKYYGNHTVQLGLGVRETGSTGAYGANGGITGVIEWVGVTNVVSGNPVPNKQVALNTSTTVAWDLPFETTAAFTGDGIVPQNNVKGVLEHVIIKGLTTLAHTAWFDDFAVVQKNNNAFTLDAGAPAGATIGYRTGKFSWTPTTGQAGVYTITVRITDRLGAQDFETIRVTVTGTGNNPPVLAAIGAKTVKEATALAFTATATDADAGQTLTFSLDAGAPAGASISTAGAFSWTPTEAQGAGNYPITVRVTDNGAPTATDFETVTAAVSEVNAAPVISAITDQTANEQALFSYTVPVSDSDVPANTMTYALVNAPEGMTVSTGGVLNWTPTEVDGPETNQVTVRVTDSGVPKLSAERTFSVIVNEVNVAPVLTMPSTALVGVPIADFEKSADGTYNGTVMFRQPSFSPTTGTFIETAPNGTSVTDIFPEGVSGSRVLIANFAFKTGQTNPWLRLTTYNTNPGNVIPNPTIGFTTKLRFSIYTDRPIKVALGVRETNTSAPLGGDGGITGTLEWLGATALGTSPVPSRTVDATNWVTLEFDVPNEVVTAFPGSGNGVLTSSTGKGVLDHLAIVPNDGTGIYNIYVDNFQVLSPTSNFTVDTGKAIIIQPSATDSDDPINTITFSLEPGAPDNMVIDSKTGEMEWTPRPDQSPSTAVVSVRATDDGIPALSDVENVTITVNRVNTAPRFVYYFKEFLVSPGELVEYDSSATDEDLPGDVLTYTVNGSLPSGATYSSAGIFSWTPTTANGTNYVTIHVADDGVPSLWDEMLLIIVVSPTNQEPVLTLSAARATESVVSYESFTNATPNEQVMFKKPSNSTTTSASIDTLAANATTVTTAFPAGNANAGAKVLKVDWTFKTGLTDYWVRLNTFNTTFLPNTTFNASARLKVDVYSTKSIKVALGIRETGTTAENGANGGSTGTIEFVGAATKVNGCPQPSRTVAANTWTTLEFDMPNEPKVGFTGDAILNAGQQVLEHLAIVGTASGAHTMYLDNFQVVTQTALPGIVTMKANSTLTFTASATDPESQALTFGLEEGAPVGSTIGATTGAFSWVPTTADTTNDFVVYVEDSPSGGQQTKRAHGDISVIVTADTLGAQSAGSAALEWSAVPGRTYQVQVQDASGQWSNVGGAMTAAESTESVVVESDNGGNYRVVEVGDAAAE